MRVRAIAAGSEHCLALTTDGRVYSWGNAPKPPDNLHSVVAIAAGTYVSLALLADGSVVGWGATEVPVDLADVTSIAAGGGMCFAVRRDGVVVGWGKHNHFDPVQDVPWPLDSPPAALSRSGGFALSIDASGGVERHRLGDFMMGEVPEPPSSAAFGVTSVAAGFAHALALKDDGSVITWANDDQMVTAELTTPAALRDVAAVAGGGAFSLALQNDGTVVGWGRNEFGQTDIPPGLNSVTAISAGTHFAAALTADGKVAAWGRKQASQTSVPSAIADPIMNSRKRRELGPITLNKDALPKAFILSGSPDEDIETSNARLPDDQSLFGTIKQMSRLVDAEGFQYQARRSVACCYNNYAARQIATGGDDDVQAATAALARADESFADIPPDADGRSRYLEMRLVIPVARAVIRINLVLALQRRGMTEQAHALLAEARQMLRGVQDDPLAPRSDSADGRRMAMVLETLDALESRIPQEPARSVAASPPASSSTSGGCYIATAVYGSYEAPEVLVLRRFRDQQLSSTSAGRAFIRFYYVVSPHLVRQIEHRRLPKLSAKWALDHLVRRLNRG